MNLRDALLAAPDHGIDRLSNEADRRVRRRIGLETVPASASRPAWFRPAIAAFAVAAAVIAVIVLRPSSSKQPAQEIAVGFVDASHTKWLGTVTATAIDVRADSPSSATVTWENAQIVAAPGTHVTATTAGLELEYGEIQVERTHATPMLVAVPVGQVVVAAARFSITAQRESMVMLLDDGSGHFVDAHGETHPLAPRSPFAWPPAPVAPQGSASGSAQTPSPPAPKHKDRHLAPGQVEPQVEQRPPGLTPPARHPDVTCTFKSDCEPGQTCRKNESGDSVCMGNGEVGAACWFDNDCLSQHCAGRRCQ